MGGHRVGAILTGPARLAEIEKFLDTVAISTSQIGQIGAEYGLREMGDSVARAEIEPDSAATQVLDWLGAGSRE